MALDWSSFRNLFVEHTHNFHAGMVAAHEPPVPNMFKEILEGPNMQHHVRVTGIFVITFLKGLTRSILSKNGRFTDRRITNHQDNTNQNSVSQDCVIIEIGNFSKAKANRDRLITVVKSVAPKEYHSYNKGVFRTFSISGPL